MPRFRRALAMFAAAATLAVIPACSTTKAPRPPTTSTVAPATTSAPPQAHGVYEQCLTQHGVPSPAAGPAPGPGPVPQGPLPGPAEDPAGGASPPPPPLSGVDQTTWDNARQACASLQPTPPPTSP